MYSFLQSLHIVLHHLQNEVGVTLQSLIGSNVTADRKFYSLRGQRVFGVHFFKSEAQVYS